MPLDEVIITMKRWLIKRYLILGMYFDLIVMIARVIKFKMIGDNQRASNEFNWLKFFWECKPESILYKGEYYKI